MRSKVVVAEHSFSSYKILTSSRSAISRSHKKAAQPACSQPSKSSQQDDTARTYWLRQQY